MAPFAAFATSIAINMANVAVFAIFSAKSLATTSAFAIFAAITNIYIAMAQYIYTPISPKDVFLPFLAKELTEAELWMGVSKNEFGNRPSGCRFIDVFAGIIRSRGNVEVKEIAREMGAEYLPLLHTIDTLTDRTAREWVDWWVLASICEMLVQTDWQMKTIAGKLNFSSPSAMSRYFTTHKKVSLSQWRRKAKR